MASMVCLLEIIQGEIRWNQRQSISFYQAFQENHDKRNQHDEYQCQHSQQQKRIFCSPELDQSGPHALTLDDIVRPAGKDHFLQDQSHSDHKDQKDGKGRSLPNPLKTASCPINISIDYCRQGVNLFGKSQNSWHPKMGERRNQDQQGTCGNSRGHQRDGNLPDDRSLAGSGDPSTFFQSRVHPFQSTDHLHEHKGEIIRYLNENDATQRIDVKWRRCQMEGIHQPGVHIAASS